MGGIIAVTGTEEGAGATTTTVLLGGGTGERRRDVALLDATVSGTRLSDVLDVEPSERLTTVLQGKTPLGELAQDGPHGTTIYTGAPAVPWGALTSGAVEALYELLRKRHERTFVDCGSPGSPASSLWIAHADELVIVTGASGGSETQRLREAADAFDISLAGVVLNRVEEPEAVLPEWDPAMVLAALPDDDTALSSAVATETPYRHDPDSPIAESGWRLAGVFADGDPGTDVIVPDGTYEPDAPSPPSTDHRSPTDEDADVDGDDTEVGDDDTEVGDVDTGVGGDEPGTTSRHGSETDDLGPASGGGSDTAPVALGPSHVESPDTEATRDHAVPRDDQEEQSEDAVPRDDQEEPSEDERPPDGEWNPSHEEHAGPEPDRSVDTTVEEDSADATQTEPARSEQSTESEDATDSERADPVVLAGSRSDRSCASEHTTEGEQSLERPPSRTEDDSPGESDDASRSATRLTERVESLAAETMESTVEDPVDGIDPESLSAHSGDELDELLAELGVPGAIPSHVAVSDDLLDPSGVPVPIEDSRTASSRSNGGAEDDSATADPRTIRSVVEGLVGGISGAREDSDTIDGVPGDELDDCGVPVALDEPSSSASTDADEPSTRFDEKSS